MPQPPPEITDTRELLSREYDVSILESDVVVQVVEGAKLAGLWDSVETPDDHPQDWVESPLAPMIDTPSWDMDLYTHRMSYWTYPHSQQLDSPITGPDSDLD